MGLSKGLKNLEDVGRIVYISPDGLDTSKFDFDYFNSCDFRENFFRTGSHFILENDLSLSRANKPVLGQCDFGVAITDENRNTTEVYSRLRNFNRRAQLTLPFGLPFSLGDSEIGLSSDMIVSLSKLFRDLSNIEPPRGEGHYVYEGPYKKVEITTRVPYRHWWRHMFVDLYSESSALGNFLDQLGNTTKEVFRDMDIWKRYGSTRRFIQRIDEYLEEDFGDLINHEWGGIREKGESVDRKELFDFLELRLLSFLRRSSEKHCFFRDAREYQYFLLAFKDEHIPVQFIHEYMMDLHKKQFEIDRRLSEFRMASGMAESELERALGSFGIKDDKLNIFFEIQQTVVNRFELLFNYSIGKDSLNEAYRNVGKIRAPIKISDELYDLGFFVFKRNRKVQPTRNSYALIKMTGRPKGRSSANLQNLSLDSSSSSINPSNFSISIS